MRASVPMWVQNSVPRWVQKGALMLPLAASLSFLLAGCGERDDHHHQTPLPTVQTPLGTATGRIVADGVERFAGIPYALPPLGPRRFAPAELSDKPWPNGHLDASTLGPPCINNPIGDPREVPPVPGDQPPPPTEDCLHLGIWRPAGGKPPERLQRQEDAGQLPVMVWNFGGGLCGGFSSNRYFDGSVLASEHGVIVVTVSYRLGALGFLVDPDFAGPGNGGMNGIRDTMIALRWVQKYISHFGGDPARVTLFGQSSGAYAACTLSVAPAAKGLFQRLVLQSGPCFGGPPNHGWGPRNESYGLSVAAEVMKAVNVSSLSALRDVRAELVQWPDSTMNDPQVAPYFSGYFEDPGLLPAPAEQLWAAGKINPKEIIVGHNAQDGTAAFYGAAPTLGWVAPDKNQTSPADYEKAMKAAWGEKAAAVLEQYPLSRFNGSVQRAFLQADADAMVVCPGYDILQYASAAGFKAWSYEFAHYQPARWRTDGFGCSRATELDVAPPRQGPETRLFAAHGDEVMYVFGNEEGPDGLGPPNNKTICTFTPSESELSQQMRARWAAFAAGGDPAGPGGAAWPEYKGHADKAETLLFADETTDLVGITPQRGLHAPDCSFWARIWAEERPGNFSSATSVVV